MIRRGLFTLLFSCTSLLSFCQLYYSNHDEIIHYNLETEESEIALLIESFDWFSQFCINFEKQEMYLSGQSNHSFSGTFDLEGRQIFDNGLAHNISSNTTAMILDESQNMVYTTSGHSIEVSDLQDFSYEMTVLTGSEIFGLALDTLNDKLYYSDRGTNRIYRANQDGSEIEEIIHLPSGLADPKGLALDLEEGKIYWANTGQKKIQRANLDGTEIENVILGLKEPENISLNLAQNEIYITDIEQRAILRYSQDTEVLDTLITNDQMHPSSLEFDNSTSYLYWINQSNATLERIDVTTKNNIGITVFTGHSSSDFKIDELQDYMFVGANGRLLRFNLDGSYGIPIADFPVENMAVDILNEEIYFTEDYWTIRKTNYDGSIDEELYTSEFFEDLSNLIYDGLNKTLYWLEEGKIYSSGTDTFSKELFFEYENPINLFTFDHVNQKLYFKSDGLIHFTNYDGSALEPIIGTPVFHMVIDPASERLFYSNNDGIFTSQLNGYYEEEFLGINFTKTFTFGSTDGYLVLPTIFTEAAADTDDNTIHLSWEVDSDFDGFTSSSVVLGEFEIEKRGEESGKFEAIGSVEYIEGTASYSFTDNDPIEGTNEYRLKYYSTYTELTSYSKYFSTVFMITSTEETFSNSDLRYSFSESMFVNNGSSGQLLIYAMDGQLVDRVNVSSDQRDISTDNLKTGMYSFVFLKNGGTSLEGRFVKI